MRNLAIRLVLWLCRRFDIVLLDEQRRIASPDAVERGMRWEAFYNEEGGLADMLAGIRKEAFEAAAELDPRETNLIYNWAIADRNARRLEQRVRNVIASGKIEADSRNRIQASQPSRKSVY
jgi:hypothetical protein